MARQRDDAHYPHGNLFIRRKPGFPKFWEVLKGSYTGFGPARTFVPGEVLKTDIPKGRIAREEAEAFGSGPQLSKKAKEAAEATAPSPLALVDEVTERAPTLPPAEALEGDTESYAAEMRRRYMEKQARRRAANGGHDED